MKDRDHKCVKCGKDTGLTKPAHNVSKCLECERKRLQQHFKELRKLEETEIARY